MSDSYYTNNVLLIDAQHLYQESLGGALLGVLPGPYEAPSQSQSVTLPMS